MLDHSSAEYLALSDPAAIRRVKRGSLLGMLAATALSLFGFAIAWLSTRGALRERWLLLLVFGGLGALFGAAAVRIALWRRALLSGWKGGADRRI